MCRYIKIATTQARKPVKSSLLMESSQDAEAGMDELMGLCSGQFGRKYIDNGNHCQRLIMMLKNKF